jgi:hypothetical protein
MPRVRADMSSVSTEYNPIEPGAYLVTIEEVKEIVDENTSRIVYEVVMRTVDVVADGSEKDINRKLSDRIHFHKKDGTLNEFGIAQLKRYFETALGEERANDEDADTDWLIGQNLIAQIGLDSYKVTDSITQEEQIRTKNVVKKLAAA